jgi:hypothetical protein
MSIVRALWRAANHDLEIGTVIDIGASVRAIDLRTPEPDGSPCDGAMSPLPAADCIPAVCGCSVRIRLSARICPSRDRWRERRWGYRQAAAGSRLRFLVLYPECAIVVRRGRQHASD